MSFAEADAADRCVSGMHGRSINEQRCTVVAGWGAGGGHGVAGGAPPPQQPQHMGGAYMPPYPPMGDWGYGMYPGPPPPPGMYPGYGMPPPAMPPPNAYGRKPRHRNRQRGGAGR